MTRFPPALARLLYSLSLWLLFPWALLHLLWRSRRQPEYRQHWGERFGHYPAPRPASNAPLIWIHAVSVGETRAAQPLVNALQARYPDHRLLLTHMTPTGRQTSQALYGDTVERAYLAYDYPGAVRHFLDHWQPSLGIIMETELWPNLLHACAHRQLPVVLANARLSQRSAGRYQKLSALVALTLQKLTGVAAQSAADAARLQALGARNVAITGNLKFDITPPADKLSLGAIFRAQIGPRPVLLCASTREGEEALLLRAWQQALAQGALPEQPLLLLVPRHPQRFDEVARLVRESGLPLARRSEGPAIGPETQVWLGDSLGEMFAYYAAADVVIMGGSLLDFGSQNLIEPCAVGRPVLLGPSTYNFSDAARNALNAGAASQHPDAASLIAAAAALLHRPDRRQAMGDAGLAFTQEHRGATARTLAWLEAQLESGGH